jgi:hypothetical protein
MSRLAVHQEEALCHIECTLYVSRKQQTFDHAKGYVSTGLGIISDFSLDIGPTNTENYISKLAMRKAMRGSGQIAGNSEAMATATWMYKHLPIHRLGESSGSENHAITCSSVSLRPSVAARTVASPLHPCLPPPSRFHPLPL